MISTDLAEVLVSVDVAVLLRALPGEDVKAVCVVVAVAGDATDFELKTRGGLKNLVCEDEDEEEGGWANEEVEEPGGEASASMSVWLDSTSLVGDSGG